MTVLHFFPATEGRYTLLCSECSSVMGDVTGEELGGMSSLGISPLCFSCDSVGADKVPAHLDNCLDGEIINRFVARIGGQSFFVDYDAPLPKFYWQPISLIVATALLFGAG